MTCTICSAAKTASDDALAIWVVTSIASWNTSWNAAWAAYIAYDAAIAAHPNH